MNDMARVLSDENMALPKVIRESQPESMDVLPGRADPSGKIQPCHRPQI